MGEKTFIQTEEAPQAIGTYSQAVKVGDFLFVSGQIPLNPLTMKPVEGGIEEEIHQVFKNLDGIARAANSNLKDIVKLNIYLTDLDHFSLVNEIMATYFEQPYPARAAVQVAALPKDSRVEMDAIIHSTSS